MESNQNLMALIPYQTKFHETNSIDFVRNQTKIHPIDVDQNRKRKRNPDDDDIEDDVDCRYPVATHVPGSSSNPHYGSVEWYERYYKPGFAECVAKYRQCPESTHEGACVKMDLRMLEMNFGFPMLDVYKVIILVEDFDKAKKLYDLDSSSRLYGAIKVCEVGRPDGKFLYKVEKDYAESINLFKNDGEITLPLSHLKHPFSLLSDIAIIVALKLNGVDLLKNFDGSDKYYQYGPYHIEEFGDEKIASGIIYFGGRPVSWLRGSFVQTRLAWGSSAFGSIGIEEKLDCLPNPISVCVEYGVSDLAVEAEVLSVAILDHSVTRVSGYIYARSCIMDPDVQSVLFEGNEVPLDSHTIPLQKPSVAVPSKSYLLITAKLNDQRGKLIVHGTFPFLPLPTGIFVSAPHGNNNIEIRVEWHRDPDRYL